MVGSSPQKCLVHVGQPKAGSTAIQRALFRQRLSLKDQRIYYWQGFQPSFFEIGGFPIEAGIGFDAGNYALTSVFMPAPPPFMKARGVTELAFQEIGELYWNSLQASVASQRKGSTTVISTEVLWHSPRLVDFVSRLHGVFDSVKLLVYLRNPLDHYPSGIGERFKGLAPLEQLVPSVWGSSPAEVVERISTAVEPHNLIVRPYPSGDRLSGDILHDFFSVLSGSVGQEIDAVMTAERSNRSLPGAFFAWLVLESGLYVDGTNRNREEDFLRLARLRRLLLQEKRLEGLPTLNVRGSRLESTLLSRFGESWNVLCKSYFANTGALQAAETVRVNGGRSGSAGEIAQLVEWLSSYRDTRLSRWLSVAWGDGGL